MARHGWGSGGAGRGAASSMLGGGGTGGQRKKEEKNAELQQPEAHLSPMRPTRVVQTADGRCRRSPWCRERAGEQMTRRRSLGFIDPPVYVKLQLQCPAPSASWPPPAERETENERDREEAARGKQWRGAANTQVIGHGLQRPILPGGGCVGRVSGRRWTREPDVALAGGRSRLEAIDGRWPG